MKRKVAIVTDTTANLSNELLKKYDIQVIPLTVNWAGRSLLDNVDITTKEFYKQLAKAKEMPTTSQPSVGQFIEFFSKVQETAETIVGIFISDELSGTLDSARSAAKEMPDLKLELVDSRTTAAALALLVMKAARLAEEGQDYQEIAAALRALVPKLRLLFLVDTLEFLHRGGRIGGAQRLIGSVLSIKPILHIDDGRVESLESVRTQKKAIARMMQLVGNDTNWASSAHYGIMDAQSPDTADVVMQKIKDKGEPAELMRSSISPVIGTHTGPGCVGIAYYME
ncbi:MAG: DegV family protein [Candidatus Promineifilaceae bacterium]|nr:DegV family protein [Candidatus Promineifilaceae bacterium]